MEKARDSLSLSLTFPIYIFLSTARSGNSLTDLQQRFVQAQLLSKVLIDFAHSKNTAKSEEASSHLPPSSSYRPSHQPTINALSWATWA